MFAASFGAMLAPLAAASAAFLVPASVPFAGLRMPGLTSSRLGRPAHRSFFQLVRLFLIFELDKVGYVEESIALQAEVDECRLHAWQNPCHTAFVNGTREGVFVFAFVVDFRELIVF
jgi:hypothetical protein